MNHAALEINLMPLNLCKAQKIIYGRVESMKHYFDELMETASKTFALFMAGLVVLAFLLPCFLP